MKLKNRYKSLKSKFQINSFIGSRLNYGGVIGALLFFCLSVLPSLMHRPWLFQTIVSGVSIAIGYAVGTVLSDLLRWATEYTLPKQMEMRIWRIIAVAAPVIVVSYALLGSIWQIEVSRLVGVEKSSGWMYVAGAILAWLLGYGLINVARSIQRLAKRVAHKVERFVPRRIGILIGILTVAVGMYWVTTGIFLSFIVTQANNFYRSKNDQTPSGVQRPVSAMRSGSVASTVAWDDLGRQGKAFVAGGPTQQQLRDFSGQPPTEPIRLYAGLKSADTPEARAQLALAELRRTGAFERDLLILANVTGTGWLEPQAVDSIEYMHNGNTAIVAQQYSYLPSWISFLVDQANATDAGQALFDAVQTEWSRLPADSRPRLITYGLSLGSFAAQSPYAGVNDLRLSVDGAVFAGTPSSTRLWRNITDARDEGSAEWQPIYRQGQVVRFESDRLGVDGDAEDWQFPRILYLQHASDPVVWFDFDLAIREPDWLNEPRGPDVSPTVHWYPFVTFLQVATDQFFGVTVPDGYGHMYQEIMVDAWTAVTAPADWSPEKGERLRAIINAY